MSSHASRFFIQGTVPKFVHTLHFSVDTALCDAASGSRQQLDNYWLREAFGINGTSQ